MNQRDFLAFVAETRKHNQTVTVLKSALKKQLDEMKALREQIQAVVHFSEVVKPYFDKFTLKEVPFKLDKVRSSHFICVN